MFAGVSEINDFLMFSVTKPVLNIFGKERGARIAKLCGYEMGGGAVLGDIGIPPANSGGYPVDDAYQARNNWGAGGWRINKARRV